MIESDDLTKDAFLGGKVQLLQPKLDTEPALILFFWPQPLRPMRVKPFWIWGAG